MADGEKDRAIYASAAVERLVGASAETIREWQERYHLPVPSLSPRGQVLYSRDDLERLLHIGAELAAGREPGAFSPDGGFGEQDGRRPRLLVLMAERDPWAAQIGEFFLRTEGYRVEVALSAEEALARTEAAHPQVVIVELAVSGHTGLALCQRLREVSDAPIIAVSSLERRDDAISAGAEAFLLKPLEPLTLISTIKDLLGASALVRDED